MGLLFTVYVVPSLFIYKQDNCSPTSANVSHVVSVSGAKNRVSWYSDFDYLVAPNTVHCEYAKC